MFPYYNMTIEFVDRFRKGGSLKAKGFGHGHCRRNHPQAALEAATRLKEDNRQIYS